jgi:hypothetical protein
MKRSAGRSRVGTAMLSILGWVLASAAGSLQAQPAPHQTIPVNQPPAQLCGSAGQRCCEDFGPNGKVTGLRNCNAGLGCDISANRCVAACGGAGQPCCDGPDTLAPRGGASPVSGPGRPLRPMCATGGCTTDTHRCVTCGQHDGDACCLPNAQSAVSTCPGPGLACATTQPNPFSGGVCQECGHRGELPCPGERCDEGLVASNELCVICGHQGELSCPRGRSCIGDLVDFDGICLNCGHIGQLACGTAFCAEGVSVDNGSPGRVCLSRRECLAFINAAIVASARPCNQQRFSTDFGTYARFCQGKSDSELVAALQDRMACVGPSGGGGGGGSGQGQPPPSQHCCTACVPNAPGGGVPGVPGGGTPPGPPGCTFQFTCGPQCN